MTCQLKLFEEFVNRSGSDGADGASALLSAFQRMDCGCEERSSSKTEQSDFGDMWVTQIEFMKLLQKLRRFPEFPVDLSTKEGQQLVKDNINECMAELFEARVLLKNAKTHRATNISEFDRSAYIEECVDVFKYFLGTLILSGVSIDEFKASFLQKTLVNTKRINDGY